MPLVPVLAAMEAGLHLVSGLHSYLGDDPELGVGDQDARQPHGDVRDRRLEARRPGHARAAVGVGVFDAGDPRA